VQLWGSSSSNTIEDELVIPNIVEEFTSDDFYEDNADDQEIIPVPTMDYNPYEEVELQKRMQFDSKEATVFAIKHYHITNGYNFNVVNRNPIFTLHDASITILDVNGVWELVIVKSNIIGKSSPLMVHILVSLH